MDLIERLAQFSVIFARNQNRRAKIDGQSVTQNALDEYSQRLKPTIYHFNSNRFIQIPNDFAN